jgi:hypothetical protein
MNTEYAKNSLRKRKKNSSSLIPTKISDKNKLNEHNIKVVSISDLLDK